jgi:hypothetical protein
VFIRPEVPEPLAAIAQDLADGAVGSVHALKLRLLAALHATSGAGSCLDDVWRTWTTLPPLPARLAHRPGWRDEEIRGIASYRGLATRYYLPTLAELRGAHAALLTERALHQGRYELAARCPTLVWQRP